MNVEDEILDNQEEVEELEDRGDNVEDEEEGTESEEGENESEDDGSESEEDEENDESTSEDDEVDSEEEEEVEEPKKNIKIPKARLDQEIQKNKELREREKWLEEQLTKLINANQQVKEQVKEESKEPPFDFEVAEEQYISLVVEGDIKEAAKLRRQIDSEKTKAIRAELEASSKENLRQVALEKENEKFNALIENYESKYAFFNPNKKGYNEEAVDTVNTLMAGLMAKGKSRSEALETAVKKVLPLYHHEPKEGTKTTKERIVEQRKKNVQTLKKTPPTIKGKGAKQVAEEVDLDNLSEGEFAKLDARTKAKLRGDLF